jgi:hypothetical protein
MLNPSAPPLNKPFQSSFWGWGEPIRQSHVAMWQTAHHGGGVFWMFRLVVNPLAGVSVPARTKLIELGGKLPR